MIYIHSLLFLICVLISFVKAFFGLYDSAVWFALMASINMQLRRDPVLILKYKNDRL